MFNWYVHSVSHLNSKELTWHEVVAIGYPPRKSIYRLNPMPNVVVFPCKGQSHNILPHFVLPTIFAY